MSSCREGGTLKDGSLDILTKVQRPSLLQIILTRRSIPKGDVIQGEFA
jgi:hypothetical protein